MKVPGVSEEAQERDEMGLNILRTKVEGYQAQLERIQALAEEGRAWEPRGKNGVHKLGRDRAIQNGVRKRGQGEGSGEVRDCAPPSKMCGGRVMGSGTRKKGARKGPDE